MLDTMNMTFSHIHNSSLDLLPKIFGLIGIIGESLTLFVVCGDCEWIVRSGGD